MTCIGFRNTMTVSTAHIFCLTINFSQRLCGHNSLSRKSNLKPKGIDFLYVTVSKKVVYLCSIGKLTVKKWGIRLPLIRMIPPEFILQAVLTGPKSN